jgi:hypothetical protein
VLDRGLRDLARCLVIVTDTRSECAGSAISAARGQSGARRATDFAAPGPLRVIASLTPGLSRGSLVDGWWAGGGSRWHPEAMAAVWRQLGNATMRYVAPLHSVVEVAAVDEDAHAFWHLSPQKNWGLRTTPRG